MSQENILDYLRKTPHNTNVNVVKGMISNSGSSLPEVTIEDNGDILTVVDGEWEKAEPGFKCTKTTYEDDGKAIHKTVKTAEPQE